MSRHKFVYMVVVDAKIRNAFFSCSATYLTKFFTDSFNFSSVPDKLRPNKNDTSPSCLDPRSVDQDILKVNSHHPIFYGAPKEPKVHFFVFISPISRLRGHHVLEERTKMQEHFPLHARAGSGALRMKSTFYNFPSKCFALFYHHVK